MKACLSAAWILLVLQQAPSTPTFKSGVTAIEVDAVVTDRSGHPVRGLGKDDFAITEDGRPVEISTFSAIDLPEAPEAASIPPADRSGSAHVSNDQPQDGRVILIVLDDGLVDLSAARMATVKSIARRAVERLGPSDLAAVVTTSGKRGGQAEFTTEKWRLLQAIDHYVPQSEFAPPAIAAAPGSSATPVESRAERLDDIRILAAMRGLTSAVKGLATIQHRRKSVLYVSQGLPASLEEIIKDPRIGSAWNSIREFFDTAQRNNIAIYTADPCGLEMGGGCTQSSRQNLRTIAEYTGGFAIVDTNAPELGAERMVTESGAYYFMSYYSPSPSNDGTHHRIKVTVRHPDVQVRSREGYWSPKRSKAAPPAAPLEALLDAPIQTRGLTMRVVAIPAPLGTEPSAAVLVGIELPSTLAAHAGRIDFTVVAIDREGHTRARLRFNASFSAPTPATPAWTHTGSRLDIPPGEYQLRVAAVGADKTAGSVFTELTVPKFDTDLGVGGLSLGAPAPAAPGSVDRLRSVLPLVPLASHDLPLNSTVDAQLPVRISGKAASSRTLTLSATLVQPDGATVQLDRAEADAGAYANPSGKVYRVHIPPLPPGSYRLVVDAILDRTHVSREVAFRIQSQ